MGFVANGVSFLCYFVVSCSNFEWVFVWRVVLICMGYYVANGGSLLCVIIWQLVICYGLLCF